jgi:hypothetical protein
MKILDGKPGRRFMARYRHRRRSRNQWLHALTMAGAVALVLLGLILLVTPGPGSLVLILGATLLARQSRRAAMMLDRAELRVRAIFRRAPAALAPATSARPARHRCP